VTNIISPQALRLLQRRAAVSLSLTVAGAAGLTIGQLQQFAIGHLTLTDEQLGKLARRLLSRQERMQA
jgi:hypothetical protein